MSFRTNADDDEDPVCEIKPKMRSPDKNKITIRNDCGKINGWCSGNARVIIRHTHQITSVAAEKPFSPERRSKSWAQVPVSLALHIMLVTVGSGCTSVFLYHRPGTDVGGKIANKKLRAALDYVIINAHVHFSCYSPRWTFTHWIRYLNG